MAAGTGIVALKYNGGVLLASDTCLCYGGMKRYPNIQRIKVVNSTTAVCCSGDYADFQWLAQKLDQVSREDKVALDNVEKGPAEIYNYLSRVQYNLRCKFEPVLVNNVVVGFKDGKSFLGTVDSIGTSYQEPECLATGFATHLAQPLLRKRCKDTPNMSREQALAAVREAMVIMFYRNTRSINRIQICDCTEKGVNLLEPEMLDTQWHVDGGYSFEKTAVIHTHGE
eukprot:TRINITY_DN67393_c6_g2_i1.p1 TRINITY_DN67393_c6_g2~~TRINITY_DN67393_c6_g2_i1.p1  ORF type:complete len:226 (+),score=19.52 TRINITY_DN67393_c6_g2_i1:59-736(+)